MTEIIKGKLTDFALSAYGHFLGTIDAGFDSMEFEGYNSDVVSDTLVYDLYRAGARVGGLEGRENGSFGKYGDVIQTVMSGTALVPDIPDFRHQNEDGEVDKRIGFSFEVVGGEIIATVSESAE
jgi:hypothetical protein